MNQPAKFWDKIAERYSKSPIADEAAYQKKLEMTQAYLQPDMEVLELACGTGSTAIIHAPRVKHFHVVDASVKMLEIAQGKAADKGIKNMTFENATIEDLSVKDQSIDVVLALNILHLLESKEDSIAKVYKMLKPGGIFISSTVCMEGMMKLLKFILPIGKLLGLIPPVKVFTRKDLENALASAGFETEQTWQPGNSKAVFIVAKKA